MQKQNLKIEHIPATLWNSTSSKVIIAVHGNMSNKEDIPIQILAEVAEHKGYQVLSFDLPQHGERQMENTLCKVEICVHELQLIMGYVKERWNTINLFANSIGAYFSLLAFYHEPIQHAWFLSPVVNMQMIIENMMMWFHVDEAQLSKEKEIATPIGQTIYWDYYCYVKKHPITNWPIPCDILYGEHDDMCDYGIIEKFVDAFHCDLQVMEGGEHYFHTLEQLKFYHEWLVTHLI